MAYISTERVAAIRKELKTKYADFKFSITKRDHSTVCIVILEAPVLMTGKKYESVNVYYIADSYTGQAKEVLQGIYSICSQGVTWYETGDYGNQPSHYIDISIGQYDKPFRYLIKGANGKPLAAVRAVTIKKAAA